MTNCFLYFPVVIHYIKEDIFITLSYTSITTTLKPDSFYCQDELKALSALFLLRKCGCECISALKNINVFFSFLSNL